MAGLFALLEASARVFVFGLAGLSPAALQSTRGLPQSGLVEPSPEPRIGFALRPNLDAVFKLAPFRTNAGGLRDEEYARRKRRGDHRIAVVGSSFAMPAGVAIEDAFHSRIEAACSRELAPARCELVNFAVGMYNPEQVLATAELRALAYEPDVVLMTATRLSMPWLVHDPRSPEGRAVRRIDPAKLPPRYAFPVLRSYFVRLVQARLTGSADERPGWLEGVVAAAAERFGPPPAPPHPLPPIAAGSVIERLAALGRARGIRVALVLLEFEDRPLLPIDTAVRAEAAAHGVPYLDTREAFRGTHASDYWIYALDPHPNAAAHAVFAEAVASFLRANGLLPPPRARDPRP